MSDIVKQDNQTIIKPGVDLTGTMIANFKNELLTTINDSSGEFAIDLDGVKMVDSVGIGVIIASYNTLKLKGRQFKVINVVKDIYDLFTTMRFDQRFSVESAG